MEAGGGRWGLGWGGGEASSLPVPLVRTFSTNHLESLSRHSDSLQRWPPPPNTSSLSPGATQQQQALSPLQAVKKLLSSQAIEEPVIGLLQSPVSCSQTRRIFQTNYPSKEIEYISGHTFVQDGNYLIHNSSSAAIRMDYRILDFLGRHFNLEQAICFSSGLLLRFSHQCPIPSVNVHGHACTQDDFYKLSDLSLCPVYPSRTPSSQVPTVLDKTMLVTTHTALGHPDPTGYGISLSTIVPQTRSSTRSPLTSPKTHTVLLHLASLRGWGASWQTRHLPGQWSHPESSQHINWLELEAIRLALLQWGPQRRNQTVRVYCVKSTAVAYISKQGGTHSISLFNKTLELFQLLD